MSAHKVLDVIRTAEMKYFRSRVLAALAPYLTDKLLRKALNVSQMIRDEDDRALTLVRLAPYSLDKLLRKALDTIQAIHRGRYQAAALVGLAPHLSETALHEALDIARVIQDKYYRAQALVKLILLLPSPQRQLALQEALGAVWAIKGQYNRPVLLRKLVPYLPESERPLVLRAIEAGFADRAEDRYWEDIGKRVNDWSKVVARLEPRLPETEKTSVLTEAIKTLPVMTEDIGVDVLAELVSHLTQFPPTKLYLLWCGSLRALATRNRQDLLSSLGSFAPVLEVLGGKEAIAETFRAIQDVGRWWP
jgi:hypothetical protein